MEPLHVFFENLALERDLLQPLDRDDIANHLLEPFAQETEGFASILDVGTGIGAIFPILKLCYLEINVRTVENLPILRL